ncbi:Hypothetical protein D9617_22g066010 [Elsinoe fawcettii]|nr:Hypothetical protein D9617_22g066010 [Elsinoe fawcettii]
MVFESAYGWTDESPWPDVEELYEVRIIEADRETIAIRMYAVRRGRGGYALDNDSASEPQVVEDDAYLSEDRVLDEKEPPMDFWMEEELEEMDRIHRKKKRPLTLNDEDGPW